MQKPNIKTIGIIGIIGGRGKLGSKFAELFRSEGYEILIAGRKTELTYRELTKKSDVIFICVPITNTVEVIEEITPELTKHKLISDFTSIKIEPVEAMLKSEAAVIGTHPIFAPHVPFKDRNIAICPERPGNYLPWLEDIFERAGMKIFTCTPKEQDQLMAQIQSLTHFLHIIFARTLLDSKADFNKIKKLESPIYRVSYDVFCRILSFDPELYGQILSENSMGQKILKDALKNTSELQEIIKNKDLKKFDKFFNETADFLGDFKKEAKEESDYLSEKLVEYDQTKTSYSSHASLRETETSIRCECNLPTVQQQAGKAVSKNISTNSTEQSTTNQTKQSISPQLSFPAGSFSTFAKSGKTGKEGNLSNRQSENFKNSENENPSILALGPELTFSDLQIPVFKKILNKKESQRPKLLKKSFTEIIETLKNNPQHLAIVPLENSIQGDVTEVLDEIYNQDFEIIAGHWQKINATLCGTVEAKENNPKNITKIFAHSQLLFQSKKFLEKHYPQAERVPVSSNAEGIRLVAESKNKNFLAVGPKEAVKHFNLEIIAENIETSENNQTFFALIKSQSPFTLSFPAGSFSTFEKSGKTGKEGNLSNRQSENFKNSENENIKHETALAFTFEKDKPASLFSVLQIFAKEKINLTKIVSRPTGEEKSDYIFYLNFEGKITENENLFQQIKSQTKVLKVLGEYIVF